MLSQSNQYSTLNEDEIDKLSERSENGDEKASFQLGQILQHGDSTGFTDMVCAIDYYISSAKQGNANGLNVLIDLATRESNEYAAYRLGQMYQYCSEPDTSLIQIDLEKAAYYYRLSAEKGSASGLQALISLHESENADKFQNLSNYLFSNNDQGFERLTTIGYEIPKPGNYEKWRKAKLKNPINAVNVGIFFHFAAFYPTLENNKFDRNNDWLEKNLAAYKSHTRNLVKDLKFCIQVHTPLFISLVLEHPEDYLNKIQPYLKYHLEEKLERNTLSMLDSSISHIIAQQFALLNFSINNNYQMSGIILIIMDYLYSSEFTKNKITSDHKQHSLCYSSAESNPSFFLNQNSSIQEQWIWDKTELMHKELLKYLPLTLTGDSQAQFIVGNIYAELSTSPNDMYARLAGYFIRLGTRQDIITEYLTYNDIQMYFRGIYFSRYATYHQIMLYMNDRDDIESRQKFKFHELKLDYILQGLSDWPEDFERIVKLFRDKPQLQKNFEEALHKLEAFQNFVEQQIFFLATLGIDVNVSRNIILKYIYGDIKLKSSEDKPLKSSGINSLFYHSNKPTTEISLPILLTFSQALGWDSIYESDLKKINTTFMNENKIGLRASGQKLMEIYQTINNFLLEMPHHQFIHEIPVVKLMAMRDDVEKGRDLLLKDKNLMLEENLKPWLEKLDAIDSHINSLLEKIYKMENPYRAPKI